ncbi:MAG: DUF362 domain-containing protein [Bacteroidetes bacterium]|nr:MAG: DUF362 domain-containing protein [Bacteroidota bacterium]
MDRRNFIRTGLLFGTATGIGMSGLASVSGNMSLFMPEITKGNYDLVAVRGDDIVAMFESAMQEMGGMSQWVKPGQTVVVKPNIGWDVVPERAANTNPELVAAIVRHCIQAGARRVNVFDHTCDNWQLSYTNSGIERAVQDAGGRMIPGNFERNYRDVTIPGAVRLKEAKVHEQILDNDVFINVPVLKHHSSTSLTIAMKNLMGIVFDRRFWHRNDLHQCIADFCLYRKPDLNIVDAMLVMTQNGPRGTSTADLVRKNSLLVSSDIVAIDAASALIFGAQPADIGYLSIADKMNIGRINLSGKNIKRVYL